MDKNKLFNFILSAVLIGIIVGCSEEKNIYETGHKLVSMVSTTEGSKIEIVVDPARQNRIALQAQIDQTSAFGIVVGVEANSNLIEEYNQKNQTNYVELPPSSYSFEVAEFIFPKYTSLSSRVSISLTSGDMQDEVSYLLPIQMVVVTGDKNASIDTSQDVIYLIVSRLPPPKLVHLENVELTTEIGHDKKNWFAAYAKNSKGDHTFTIEEAAEQSHMMDFVLVKHGTTNLKIHPSIIGWQHGGDYHRYTGRYTNGFEKLTMTTNMNKLFSVSLFEEVITSEGLVNKIAELRTVDGYAYYTTDRMTSHNLQSQITGENRVLIIAWGPKIGQNEQFGLLYIKEVTSLPGGEYKMVFDIKYIDHDIRSEVASVNGQNVVINNPGYLSSNDIVEYKGVELTTEIGSDKKNWFAAYADNKMVTFTQDEAKSKSNMMDFVSVIHSDGVVRLYSAIIFDNADYKERMTPYVKGFPKLTYTMLGGWRPGAVDATKPEHYDGVTDATSLRALIDFYRVGYAYPVADRRLSDNLAVNAVGVFGWGHRVAVNNSFGIYIVRDVQPTVNGHYKVVLDIKVPKSNARTPNNASMITNPG